jgi:hypothetical protein
MPIRMKPREDPDPYDGSVEPPRGWQRSSKGNLYRRLRDGVCMTVFPPIKRQGGC